MRGSSGPRGWPVLGNDRGPTTTGGPRCRVVVRHQALGVGCDSGNGQLDNTPMTHYRRIANRLSRQRKCRAVPM